MQFYLDICCGHFEKQANGVLSIRRVYGKISQQSAYLICLLAEMMVLMDFTMKDGRVATVRSCKSEGWCGEFTPTVELTYFASSNATGETTKTEIVDLS